MSIVSEWGQDGEEKGQEVKGGSGRRERRESRAKMETEEVWSPVGKAVFN